jgi:hypothetical protein
MWQGDGAVLGVVMISLCPQRNLPWNTQEDLPELATLLQHSEVSKGQEHKCVWMDQGEGAAWAKAWRGEMAADLQGCSQVHWGMSFRSLGDTTADVPAGRALQVLSWEEQSG